MANPSVRPWHVSATGHDPTGSITSDGNDVQFCAGIIAVVDTASTTLTVLSGDDTIFTATLGVGTHIMGFPSTEDTPGMPAMNKGDAIKAGLSSGGSAQVISLYGSSRPIEIVTS